jgi:hypothetical protein
MAAAVLFLLSLYNLTDAHLLASNPAYIVLKDSMKLCNSIYLALFGGKVNPSSLSFAGSKGILKSPSI